MKNSTLLSVLFSFISLAAFAQNREIGTRAQNSTSLSCPASLSADLPSHSGSSGGNTTYEPASTSPSPLPLPSPTAHNPQ
jgi:hypothetical protein